MLLLKPFRTLLSLSLVLPLNTLFSLAVVAAPQPGEQQLQLAAQLTGNWQAKITTRATPDGPAETSTGTGQARAEMNGLHIRMDYQGAGAAGTYRGVRYNSYDPVRKKYVEYWADNASAGPMYGAGDYDAAAKTYKFEGKAGNPARPGEEVPLLTLLQVIDRNHLRFEDRYRDDKGQWHTVFIALFTRAE